MWLRSSPKLQLLRAGHIGAPAIIRMTRNKSVMAKVKGSPVYRLKIVPHRPLRSVLIALVITVLVLAAIVASYLYAEHKTSQHRLSPDEALSLKSQLETLTNESAELRRELATYQLSAEVDRQAGEELRKRVVELRAEKRHYNAILMFTESSHPIKTVIHRALASGCFQLHQLLKESICSSWWFRNWPVVKMISPVS